VCDSDLKITYILSRYPGSTHESFVWLTTITNNISVGDSDYPHEPSLHTPILNAEECTLETRYTRFHIKARSAVERCIGILNGRFRCLLLDRKLEYEPRKACQFINACCVLHKMRVLGGVPYVEDDVQIDDGYQVIPQQQGVTSMLNEARAVGERVD
ncbi:hypothetical protein J437_LFUL017353, partial [Ladona fulva]